MADPVFHGALQENAVVLTREVFSDLVHALLAHRSLSPIWALPGCEQEAIAIMEDLVRLTTSELVRRLHGQTSASGGDFFEGIAQVAKADLLVANKYHEMVQAPPVLGEVLGSHVATKLNLNLTDGVTMDMAQRAAELHAAKRVKATA